MDPDVTSALRLGWELAEARGRSWPQGPRTASDVSLPNHPEQLLPLRFQRDQQASRTETITTLVALATRLRIPNAAGLPQTLRSQDEHVSETDWSQLAKDFVGTDAYIQDELAQRDDALANAYLLGRGLSECYWGLGEPTTWTDARGASPQYLLGKQRREELRRMLGRLKSGQVHELTPAVIDGSLEAWGSVVETPQWVASPDLRARLYEQVRRWYQLLVLGQDPTTLVPPGARLTSGFYFVRTLRAFAPQLVLAVLALAITTVAVSGRLGDVNLTALLPTGLGALGLAGLLARGRSMAQQLVVRLRQDAYTDLVASHATSVPEGGSSSQLQKLVRRRLLTPPTEAPPASGSNAR